MKKFLTLLATTLILLPTWVAAQSIDFGRGELPVTVPDGYSSDTPAPLIVLLHGYTSSGEGQDSYLGFSRVADRYGFLFVAPDGDQEASDDRSRFWNATDACCDFFGAESDDSDYIHGIINKMKDEYNVDSSRVYLVGHSNGGFMSYQMAYLHSDDIAAIASLAGASHNEDRDAPGNPVHVLQIHGTNDTTIVYDGGDIQGNNYPSAMQTVTQWASYNGCSTEGAARELRDLESSLDGHESEVMLFEVGCETGGSAELWTIQDGSHVPRVSETFSSQVVEWLYAHPKQQASYAD
jgi:polyhydroxybutyrate depolymerase